MCICLNCSRINFCKLYLTIEQQHVSNDQKSGSLKKAYIFPQHPIILSINFFGKENRSKYSLEWDVNDCLSFEEKPSSWRISNSYVSRYISFDKFLK